jgi:hypothetical protein
VKLSLPAITLCGAVLLLGAAGAQAATRYAAPGGTAPASSDCLQSNPCSLFNAASRSAPNTKLDAGDEIVVAPGSYSDLAGDLGPSNAVSMEIQTTVHGIVGMPRPVIAVHGDTGIPAFILEGGGTALSWLEITSPDSRRAFLLREGTVDGVIARFGKQSTACTVEGGVVRNTACFSTGSSGIALGGRVEEFGMQAVSVKLRNVTAIATGANSRGVEFRAIRSFDLNVDAIGVLARGTAEDVFAAGLSPGTHTPGTGGRASVELDHSDFVDVGTEIDAGGGTATVTAPGSGTNITAPPLLAADGFHELVGSPTIDAGALDAESGPLDLDGEGRSQGPRADIGADEFFVPAPKNPDPPGKPAPPKRERAPNTTLKRKPARRTTNPRATFTFVSDLAGSRFECKLDRKAFKPCRSPFKAKLKNGQHSLQVRAVNRQGLADRTPATFRWLVSPGRRD